MEKIKVKENIYLVGAVDWNVRNFHGYTTRFGTSYNAYLILDEKVALVDTVKENFADDMIKKISEIISPEKIDYIVVHHSEKDHSSSLPHIKNVAKNAKIITSKKCSEILKNYYGLDEFEIIKTGSVLNLGKYNLKFFEIPMVHWPDSTVSYIEEEKILLSSDAFGQHIASSFHFDDEISEGFLFDEAAKYYANIVMLYNDVVEKVLQSLGGLEIDTIAPAHGIIWRKNINKILSSYKKWAAGENDKKIIIVYDTMWKSTEKMAFSILEGIQEEGVEVKIFNLTLSDLTEIIKEILTCKGIIVGTPTLNQGMFPTVASFLTYLKGLKPKNKIGWTFGSFGWTSKGEKEAEEELKKAGVEIVQEAISCKFLPSKEEIAKLKDIGKKFAQKVKTGG